MVMPAPKHRKHPVKEEKLWPDLTPMLIENLADIVRYEREDVGLTLEQLGERIKEKASYLKRVEEGELVPSEQLVGKLEQFFSVELHKVSRKKK